MKIAEKVKAGVLGFALGDALGVPVEFVQRDELKNEPVESMREFGTWNQPKGTWSDDTSMTLATMESIARLKKLDYQDVMQNFVEWYVEEKFTATGEVFDIGTTTARALERFLKGTPALACGLTEVRSNGNGSLMRMLPMAFYLYPKYGCHLGDGAAMTTIYKMSALTHAHHISQKACGIYCMLAAELIDGRSIKNAVANALKSAKDYFVKNAAFERLLSEGNFGELPEDSIRSTGYVVDTLEAVIWCLLNTDSYKSAVLKAVNLGGDTDTIAAITGGLAGIVYGLDSIPDEWSLNLKRRDYLMNIAERFGGYIAELAI